MNKISIIGILVGLVLFSYTIIHQHSQIEELKTTLYKTTQKIQTVDSLHKIIDSLSNENFIYRTNCDRYEITLERLEDEDSITAAIFEIYLNQAE